jgi:hypothetical protein
MRRLALAAALILVLVPAAAADVPMRADGPFTTLVRHGNAVYAAGEFSVLGPQVGGAVTLAPDDAHRLWTAPPLPSSMQVIDAVDDGAGGWYVVDGTTGITHLTADGHRDGAWPGTLHGDAIRIVRSGSTLVVVDGLNRVEAVTTGAHPVSLWTAQLSGEIDAIAASATTVYVGGFFGHVGAVARAHLAALSLADGSVLAAFHPDPNRDVSVLALDPGGGTLYVGGMFDHISGVARPGLAAVAATDGAADPSFVPSTAYAPVLGPVTALAVSATTVYAGWQFGDPHGDPQVGLAALSRATGARTPLPLPRFGGVATLSLSGGTLYAGGFFETAGSVQRLHAAAIDTATGALTGWDPAPDSSVTTLVATPSGVLMAGSFSILGGTAAGGAQRSQLVAFDATTGAILPFDAHLVQGSVSYDVTALAVHGSTLYVAGKFGSVDGRRRDGLAAFDLDTGRLLPWHPRITGGFGEVLRLTISGGVLFAAGDFTHVGHRPRGGVAAFSLASGRLLPFRVTGISRSVVNLAVAGGRLLLAWFTGGGFQEQLAAVDLATGRARPWAPGALTPPQYVTQLLAAGHRLIVIGPFTRFEGVRRRNVVALRPSDGRVLALDARMASHSSVDDGVVSGGVLYLAGRFSRLGRVARRNLGAIDLRTGRMTAWRASVPGEVTALLVQGRWAFAAGHGWWAPLEP